MFRGRERNLRIHMFAMCFPPMCVHDGAPRVVRVLATKILLTTLVATYFVSCDG